MRRREMRGDDPKVGAMWSYVSPEARVSPDHPLRAIRTMVERTLTELDPVFRKMYSPMIDGDLAVLARVCVAVVGTRRMNPTASTSRASLRPRWPKPARWSSQAARPARSTPR
jgi:hypothetical protein